MQLDTLGRRSRHLRCRVGKRLILGDRDIKILQFLYRYRYLRQDHLIAFLTPKSEKRCVERLGDLFHETGLINRPKGKIDQFNSYCSPMLYEISERGIRYLRDLSSLPHRAVTFSRRRRSAFNPQFQHTMAIIDALVQIECETRGEPNRRFVPVDEILARAPERTRRARNPLAIPVNIEPFHEHPIIKERRDTHLIPDALYGIEYIIDGSMRYRFWALECEQTTPLRRQSTKASSRALKKATYAALLRSRNYREHWGIPNLMARFLEV